MFVFRLRGFPMVALLTVLLVVVGGFGLFRPEVQESCQLEQLSGLPWGSEVGQLGKKQGLDGRWYGPRSFAVDDRGYLYVGDTFNNRVAILDAEANWITEFEFRPEAREGVGDVLIQDLGVDSERNIYVADFGGSGIFKYDHVGNLLQEWPLAPVSISATTDPEETVWITETIAVEGPDEVIVARTQLAQDEYVRDLIRIDMEAERVRSLASTVISETTPGTVEELEGPARFYSFAVMSNGRLVTEWPEGPFGRTVTEWDADGQVVWQVTIDSDRYIDEAALLGADRYGKVYLGLNLNQGAGIIYRIASEGVEWTIPVVAEPTALANVYARCTMGGDLYVMSPANSGVEFSRYRCSRSWSLQPRWH